MNMNFSISFIILLFFKYLKCSKAPDGALISVHFTSEIGFLLDELPDFALVKARNYILRSVTEDDWRKRVVTQIKMSLTRQVFRQVNGIGNEKQLTIPPEELWKISFTDKPKYKKIQNHKYISRSYTFYSVLVAPSKSVYQSEPKLVPIGGTFCETYHLPVDPNDIFQRTGYACMNEASFSFETVYSANAHYFFDSGCGPEEYTPVENRTFEQSLNNCHWSTNVTISCVEALEKFVGYIDATYIWTRLHWNEAEARKWRFGKMTAETADLSTMKGSLENSINYHYRYFDDNSCAIREAGVGTQRGCISGPGWRQLLKFTSSSINVGKTDVFLGDINSEEQIKANFFVYSDCHHHFHFQHYGKFMFGNEVGRKVGFCLQTTWRYFNNEWTSLNTPYETCLNQGISPGWGDDYIQGIDCQWIDVTGFSPQVYNLTEEVNSDKYMCEGVINTYPNNSRILIDSGSINLDNNKTEYMFSCNFTNNFFENNVGYYPVNFHGQSDANMALPCNLGPELTPVKDCGFDLIHDNLICTPDINKTIVLQKQVYQENLIIRVCESSIVLGHSVYCEYEKALANVLFTSGKLLKISFKCPGKRDAIEIGGRFSIFVSSLIPDQTLNTKITLLA